MDGIDWLMQWFQEIQAGESPKVPYHLHDLVRCLHNNLGTTKAINDLKQLKEFSGKEEI